MGWPKVVVDFVSHFAIFVFVELLLPWVWNSADFGKWLWRETPAGCLAYFVAWGCNGAKEQGDRETTSHGGTAAGALQFFSLRIES